jgi:hypothetical protein
MDRVDPGEGMRTLARIRFQNRLARKLNNLAVWLTNNAHAASVDAVVGYHKAQGTWPQPDHIYPEMRGA